MTPNNQIPEEEQQWEEVDWPPREIRGHEIRGPPREIEEFGEALEMSRQEPETAFTEKLLGGGIVIMGTILAAMMLSMIAFETSQYLLEVGIITGLPSVTHIPASLVILLGMTIAVVSFVYCVGDAVERMLS